MSETMQLTLQVWRQKSPETAGKLVRYELDDVSSDMSFLEVLDLLNRQLMARGEEPVAFDHDCREGICGTCSLVLNGQVHGPEKGTTVCQLHMRRFKSGATIVVEPFRAGPFPVIRDLVVDRSAFDDIMVAGGYVSVRTGQVPDANALPVGKESAELSMDAASCIGCGACVASCKNASAMLFVSAKVSHLALLPQGEVEKDRRAQAMVKTMDALGFGNCTNERECEAACPKEISFSNIARLNRHFVKASIFGRGS